MEEMIEQDSSSDNESDTTSDSSSSSSSEEMMMGYMYEIKTNNNNNETSMKLPSAVSDCDIYATQLPAIVDEHIPEEEISDEALLQLMENFDAKKQHTTTSTSINMTTEVEENQQNENISEKTPWRKVEKTHFTPYLSPYLQPFTPSKCSTPGRYLYLPSLDDTSNHQLSSSNKKKNISQQPNQLKTFYWKHLSERQNCHEFLNKLQECNSFSFELVFDSIPFSSNGLSRAIVSRAWAPMISSCHTSTSTIQDSKGNQNTLNLPEMLVGISLCFGDDVGYYLPLPKILPLLSFNQPQTPRIETRRIPGLDTLPDRAMILICRYVGFGSILHKCPGLYPTETNWNFLLNSNPLFLVSRSWAECSRRSLRYEWMRGQCLEWRLLGKIMNSTKFCKIGFNIKEKIICLRERDVIVHGSIQDPCIAQILLEMEPSRISSNFIKSSNKNHIKEACYLAINTFHCMIELEQKLLIHQLWSTFITIEMPLCHTVADAELHGIPINTSFFVDLRQDLNDRIKLIENFFYITQGIQFNLTNHKDITQLKKKLQLEEENHPILQIIQEWRSHTRMLPLCNLILNHRCRPYGYYIDRTRGKYHSIGTETGRLIITSPPLQQIPHSCSYIPPKRASIHTEIRKAKLLNSNFIKDVNRKASSGEFEWVRVTKMMQNKSLNDLYESDFYTNNEMKPNNIISSSSTGRLISITSTSIDKIFIPVPHHIENTSTSTSTSSSTISLLELWKQAGYHQYSTSTSSTNNDDEDNQDILGVLVNINNKVYSYPADQVFRLQSSIIPDPNETLQLHSSLNIQQQQPPQQQQQPIENISKIILNPRDGFQATPGYIFISSDYSQIELRLFAHFAMDKKLYDAFIHDEDVFKSIASQWKSKDIHSITDIERNSVKQLCYALLYGAGPNKVAIDANCSLQEAELMIENFLKYYSGIPKFISEVKKRCRINGYVETMLGRKRHLPHIRSLDKKERLKAERQAVNTVCQGSAADLIKVFVLVFFVSLIVISSYWS